MLERHQHEIVTAALVWHELQYGCQHLPRSHKRNIFESFLSNVAQNMLIFPYDERAAAWHAGERARLSSQGKMPSFVDEQIAAIACVNGLILVTRNIGNFEPFFRTEN